MGFFLHTDDFARDHARMTAAGVTFLEKPRHEPYGSVAVFQDLYGNRWDLLQPAGFDPPRPATPNHTPRNRTPCHLRA